MVGSAMVRRLAAEGVKVHVLLREGSSTGAIAEVLDRVMVHRVVLDGERTLAEQLPGVVPDYILHFAQPAPQLLKEEEGFFGAMRSAVTMMGRVLDFAEEVGANRLVHACSSTIYGDSGAAEFKEDDSLLADSRRGKIKLAEYELCQQYAQQGCPVVFGRIFRAYGPWDSPKKLIMRALRAHAAGEEIQLVPDLIKRDYVHVEDIAEVFLRMCTAPLSPGMAFNVGAGKEYSAREIVELISVNLDTPVRIKKEPYPLSDMDKEHWRASIVKAKEVLGWSPQVTMEAGIKGMVNWYYDQEGKYG